MSLRALRSVVVAVALGSSMLLLAPRSASAQCGAKRSSCSACHEGGSGRPPVPEKWHDDHAFADVCPVCHGGDGTSDDPTLAHAGLHDPLADDSGCVSCHGSDTASLERAYVGLRAGDGGTSGTTTVVPRMENAPARPPLHGERTPNLILTGIVVGLGAFGTAVFAHDQRRRGRKKNVHEEERG